MPEPLERARELEKELAESRRVEEELRQAKEYAETLIRTANVLVVGLDNQGRVTLLNQAGEKVTGYRQAEVIGKDWFELLVPKEKYPRVWDEFAKLQRAGKVVDNFENPILTKSGEERLISWQNSNLVQGGKMTGTISFGIDITERRRAEEAMAGKVAELEKFYKVAMGREERIMELKKENAELKKRLGET
ncbi:MAG: PAS domain S-box protein [Candidatus Margulisbacteria bacterium]|jgi:PAS domain S-box-containing protein|nr:PAS domain S-box protein [Candidatus Margulisiibacteriota bacterium]